MRTIALLALLGLPTLAFAKHHPREKSRDDVRMSAAAPTRAEPVHHAMVEQADDDERPGSRQKK